MFTLLSVYLRTSRTTLLLNNRKSISTITNPRPVRFNPLLLQKRLKINMPPKRKRSSNAVASEPSAPIADGKTILPPSKAGTESKVQPTRLSRQNNRRGNLDTNPDHNADIIDSKVALRASPDADGKDEALDISKVVKVESDPNSLGDVEGDGSLPFGSNSSVPVPAKKQKKMPTKSSVSAKKGSDEIKAFKAEQAAKKAAEVKVKKEDDDEWDNRLDPDGDDVVAEDLDAVKLEATRPPPVNSDYLPLPWKGRIGYVSCDLSLIIQLLTI
jgi:UV DNA damage endonuclease